MKVVILCGGMGTRLREETEYRPKPMVEIGQLPILWHIMKHFAAYGHKEFVLCLGYKGDIIKRYFRDYQWNVSDVTLRLGANPQVKFHNSHEEDDWEVTLLDTGQHTMTGGRLKRALPHLGDQSFFLTYGDGVSDVNLDDLLAGHRRSGVAATLTAVHPASRYGDITIDGDLVRGFKEKAIEGSAPISGGFFVMESEIGAYLDGDECVLEGSPLEKMAAEGRLGVHRHPGFWQCMDTYREQQMLEEIWRKGDAPWKTW